MNKWETPIRNLIVAKRINNKNQCKFKKTEEILESQKHIQKRTCPKRTDSMPRIIVRRENRSSKCLSNKTVS